MKKQEMLKAIERAKDKLKNIESKMIAVELREDSAWLNAINDIIDRAGLAVLDELDSTQDKIIVEVRGGVAYCDDPNVEIVDYD